jgi:hypothetical protein
VVNEYWRNVHVRVAMTALAKTYVSNNERFILILSSFLLNCRYTKNKNFISAQYVESSLFWQMGSIQNSVSKPNVNQLTATTNEYLTFVHFVPYLIALYFIYRHCRIVFLISFLSKVTPLQARLWPRGGYKYSSTLPRPRR